MISSRRRHEREISKSQVTRLCEGDRERVKAFLETSNRGRLAVSVDTTPTYVKVPCGKAGNLAGIVYVAVNLSPWASTAMVARRCLAWISAHRRPRPSGPGSCAKLTRRGLTWRQARGLRCRKRRDKKEAISKVLTGYMEKVPRGQVGRLRAEVMAKGRACFGDPLDHQCLERVRTIYQNSARQLYRHEQVCRP